MPIEQPPSETGGKKRKVRRGGLTSGNGPEAGVGGVFIGGERLEGAVEETRRKTPKEKPAEPIDNVSETLADAGPDQAPNVLAPEIVNSEPEAPKNDREPSFEAEDKVSRIRSWIEGARNRGENDEVERLEEELEYALGKQKAAEKEAAAEKVVRKPKKPRLSAKVQNDPEFRAARLEDLKGIVERTKAAKEGAVESGDREAEQRLQEDVDLFEAEISLLEEIGRKRALQSKDSVPKAEKFKKASATAEELREDIAKAQADYAAFLKESTSLEGGYEANRAAASKVDAAYRKLTRFKIQLQDLLAQESEVDPIKAIEGKLRVLERERSAASAGDERKRVEDELESLTRERDRLVGKSEKIKEAETKVEPVPKPELTREEKLTATRDQLETIDFVPISAEEERLEEEARLEEEKGIFEHMLAGADKSLAVISEREKSLEPGFFGRIFSGPTKRAERAAMRDQIEAEKAEAMLNKEFAEARLAEIAGGEQEQKILDKKIDEALDADGFLEFLTARNARRGENLDPEANKKEVITLFEAFQAKEAVVEGLAKFSATEVQKDLGIKIEDNGYFQKYVEGLLNDSPEEVINLARQLRARDVKEQILALETEFSTQKTEFDKRQQALALVKESQSFFGAASLYEMGGWEAWLGVAVGAPLWRYLAKRKDPERFQRIKEARQTVRSWKTDGKYRRGDFKKIAANEKVPDESLNQERLSVESKAEQAREALLGYEALKTLREKAKNHVATYLQSLTRNIDGEKLKELEKRQEELDKFKKPKRADAFVDIDAATLTETQANLDKAIETVLARDLAETVNNLPLGGGALSKTLEVLGGYVRKLGSKSDVEVRRFVVGKLQELSAGLDKSKAADAKSKQIILNRALRKLR